MTETPLVQELRHHAKMAWLIKYKSHPCWKAADAIETLTAALKGLLDCPAIADGDHNDPEWGCSETAEAESRGRTALAQARAGKHRNPS